MRGGPLSESAIVELLRPFIVTSWHGADEAAMDPDVRTIFTGSKLSSDPHRLNVFAFVLDHQGQVVHEFHGVPGSRARMGPDRSDWEAELLKARAKLHLPEAAVTRAADKHPIALPDLHSVTAESPAGVRLFIRLNEPSDPFRSRIPVIEVVSMKTEEWQALNLPEKSAGKELAAETLRKWLVHLYPAGIRTADQTIPFRTISGSLRLEPAGSDEHFRRAVLRGDVHLAKGEGPAAATESAFEGRLEAVLTYRTDKPEVHSLRGIIEGEYLYRIRGTHPMQLRAAIESRPE